jgi:glycosyltransferase involved in cell wall biosynthesis
MNFVLTADPDEKPCNRDGSVHPDAKAGDGLAIVMPAFKGQFLAKALDSLAAQTDRNFRVYIGDDCSPEDLEQICRRYETVLDLRYCRFEQNLGRISLADQWNRCVELSTEPWIWLFADDDIMERESVERFYRVLDETRGAYDVYRFNTLTIDGAGQVCKINRPHPEHESALEFAYHRLRGNRDSYASEYIFSRIIFDKCGGMVRYPLAWCADDASWIRFSAEKGIKTIGGTCIHWRRSGLNITAVKGDTIPEKLKAAAIFLNDLDHQFSAEDFAKSRIPRLLFEEARQDWFLGQIQSMAPIPWRLWLNWPALPENFGPRKKIPFFARLGYIHLLFALQVAVRKTKRIIDV